MADSLPTNVVDLLKDLVGAVVMQQAQIAELQADRTTLATAVTDLQGHAETVTGDTGLTSQLGDLSQVPVLQQQLAAAMPVPVEAAPVAAQDPAIQAAA